ncbi:MAG: DUF2807 domain-containing protein [Crocinitomicaceae bacterium]|nr:DUF2807 domain-containing protein [Crocinitomicaceae bacterium]
MRGLLICLMGLMSLAACKKAENRRCVKSAGADAELVHEVDPFNKLDIGPKMKVVLVQDTVEKVIVRGGENLINFIQLDVTDGKLTIENNNTCNFLRSYKHVIEVEIHLINVINVLFRGTKELSCSNQLDLPYLTFVIEEGAGQCNLNLNCNSLFLGSGFGWGNYDVEGQTNYLKIDLRDNGFGDLYDLQIQDSATVISSSSERMKINLGGTAARVETSSYGDVWYIGTPTFLEYNQYGEGELIDQN